MTVSWLHPSSAGAEGTRWNEQEVGSKAPGEAPHTQPQELSTGTPQLVTLQVRKNRMSSGEVPGNSSQNPTSLSPGCGSPGLEHRQGVSLHACPAPFWAMLSGQLTSLIIAPNQLLDDEV